MSDNLIDNNSFAFTEGMKKGDIETALRNINNALTLLGNRITAVNGKTPQLLYSGDIDIGDSITISPEPFDLYLFCPKLVIPAQGVIQGTIQTHHAVFVAEPASGNMFQITCLMMCFSVLFKLNGNSRAADSLTLNSLRAGVVSFGDGSWGTLAGGKESLTTLTAKYWEIYGLKINDSQ